MFVRVLNTPLPYNIQAILKIQSSFKNKGKLQNIRKNLKNLP